VRALLLGSGGRESALASGLSRSRAVDELVAAPGNPGIAAVAELVDVDPSNVPAVVDLAARLDAGLVVVGPEAPLVAGVSDALRAAGRRVFGPDRSAAAIEGSKAHAKKLMDAAGIPTAMWKVHGSLDSAIAHLNAVEPPYVVKADGLAAGKGVVVTTNYDAALEAARTSLVEGAFGDAGRRVVIEEFLDGQEASLIAFSDGRAVVACEPAQDYKRVNDDDGGPNTGGMGSYSPVPACPPELADEIVSSVIGPMIRATAEKGAPFVGALYAGLALTSRGPRVVEFNARFGDPETQALIPRLESDLGEVCLATASGELEGVKLQWSRMACVSVVLASGGYPGAHDTGLAIDGLEDAARIEGVEIFHAGTARSGQRIVTAGGRVLAVSALGESFRTARERAYDAARLISFDGKHARTDIAARAQEAEEART
jgi:phosphoribosylamine---glycine ligase